MLTLDRLIKVGYFPQELVPPLNTEELAQALPAILSKLPKATSRNKLNKSRCGIHSIPRPRNFRRVLGIPNPLHQIRLSQTVADNWPVIDAYCLKSPISLSTPVVDVSSPRALTPRMSYREMTEERILRSTSARHLLQLDISRFYHSIYTHTICWALHGKAIAKDNHSRALPGNALDEDARNTRDAQTVGVPIGPDTSRIISEIIGVAIDLELQQRLGQVIGVRWVDDYYLYFRSLSDLQMGFAVLQGALREYELDLNPAKGHVVDLPEALEGEWVHDLQQFRFRNKVSAQRTDLISYFHLAYRNSVLYPDDSVIQYALQKVSSEIIAPDNFIIYEALLLKTIMVEPKALPIVLRILLTYESQGYSLDKRRISATVEELLAQHCRLNHGFEMSWALWLCKSLKIPINHAIVDLLSDVTDPATALVALDLQDSCLTQKTLNTSKWQQLAGKDALYSEFWLLAYEASVKGWMPMHSPPLTADPFFGLLVANSVEFYDAKRQIELADIFIDSAASSLPFQIPDDLLSEELAALIERDTVS